MNNKPYFLALNRIHSIGPRTTMKLVARWPSLEALFALQPEAMAAAGLPEKIIQAISQFDLEEIKADLDWEQQACHHHLLTWDHPSYPALLREIDDPPIVLYAIGDLSCFHQPCVAMVGTRKPSVTGSETARRFAYELACKKITVVSGLALGIDAQAHAGCLEGEGKTIAVMGTGIDCIYPRRHQSLAYQICQKGLLLSEFPLKSQPTAGHFPRRNRIISGLSLSTLVVEAAIRSGSLITARLALEQNREVMAVPGSIHNPQSRGCHHLLQQGAKLVTGTRDILEELGLENHIESAVNHQPALASGYQNLVKCVGFEITSVDQIAIRTGLPVEDVACGLAALELEGIVSAVSGGYMRCI